MAVLAGENLHLADPSSTILEMLSPRVCAIDICDCPRENRMQAWVCRSAASGSGLPLAPLVRYAGFMTNTAGAWTTKATDGFTLKLAIADATAACMKAGEDTKGWQIEETESHRILVKNGPGVIDMRPYHVEVSLTDAEGGEITFTLNGWSFGKGPGLTRMVKRAIGEFRTAIEEQAPSN